jgi:hypothetical protein
MATAAKKTAAPRKAAAKKAAPAKVAAAKPEAKATEPASGDTTSTKAATQAEASADRGDDYVVRVRAGYGQQCAACDLKMQGGQALTLDGKGKPIHRACQ